MPKSYGAFFASVQASSDVAGNPLTPDMVMLQATSKYDRRQLENAPKRRAAPTGDQALYLFSQNQGHSRQCSKRGGKKDEKCTCFNCGEAGHMKRDCKKPKKDGDNSKGSSSSGASQGANTGSGKKPTQSVSIAEVKEDAPPPKDGYSAVAFVGYTGDARGAILDSRCTMHISPHRDLFTNYTPIDSIPITAANKTSFEVVGCDDVKMSWPNRNDTMRIMLRNVLHCPGIAFTLVSMSTMNRAGYVFALKSRRLLVKVPRGEKIAKITLENGLYRIPMPRHFASAATGGELVVRIDDLHRRLGHVGVEACRDAVHRSMVEGIKLLDASAPATTCEPCARSKAAEKPFPKVSTTPHATIYGRHIHLDVWGPAPIRSLGGREYMLTFTDEFMQEVSLYFLAKKSDAFAAYKQFEAWVSTHRKGTIKILCTDCGGEYMLHAFAKHLSDGGTEHQLTVHDSPSQNGVTERLNCTLVMRARTCMIEANDLPQFLWAEALQYTAWMKNRTPTCTLMNKTPHEMVTGLKPDLRNAHTWGSHGFIRVEGRSKLEPQADTTHFVGHNGQSKGYRMYWPSKRTVSIEQNVQWVKDGPAQFEGEIHTVVNLPEPSSTIADSLRSRRATNAAIAFDSAAPWELGSNMFVATGAYWALAGEIIRELRHTADAKNVPQWPEWEAAMKEEMSRIQQLGTWELVPKPEGVNIIGCKWVYKVKRDQNGDVSRYKARLVAQGFTQVPGVNYIDTFAPVAKFSMLRILLALAAQEDLEVHQMDMKNAYLNGKLTETIYMRQPPGFINANHPKHMCRLVCSLYGLRQSGRVWYQTLTNAFKDLGFAVCMVDHAVFISHGKEGKVIVRASMDDLLIISNSINRVNETKRRLEKHFEMTDLGEVKWLLGMEIRRDRARRTLSLSQSAFVKMIVGRFNLEDANTVTTPMDPSVKLSKEQSPKTDEEKEDMADVPYRKLIGSLMYASVATRPNVVHAITALSQFLENPRCVHWQVGLRVLRYLKGTADYALTYRSEDGVGMPEGKPLGYTDTDFASQEHRHSVSGYAFLMHGGAVSWSSKTQAVIALSSTEAEYITGTHAAKEAKWLTMLLSEIGVEPPRPFPVLANNLSAIALSKDNVTCTLHVTRLGYWW
jgi:hypothetical protein